jgi:hypothetical protein
MVGFGVSVPDSNFEHLRNSFVEDSTKKPWKNVQRYLTHSVLQPGFVFHKGSGNPGGTQGAKGNQDKEILCIGMSCIQSHSTVWCFIDVRENQGVHGGPMVSKIKKPAFAFEAVVWLK